MARSPGMSQALARSPGLVVSTVLTCMVGALLPPLPGLTLFAGGLGLLAVLCAGAWSGRRFDCWPVLGF